MPSLDDQKLYVGGLGMLDGSPAVGTMERCDALDLPPRIEFSLEPGSAASTGTSTDNHVYGNAATGIAVDGDFIVARNYAQGNGTNYDLATAANAATVTPLAGSTSPWDNISE